MKKLIKRFNLSDRRLDVGVILFTFFSLALFYPLLQGKQLFQSDSIQYSGMARQLNENRLEKRRVSFIGSIMPLVGCLPFN